jgi:hypothetical protein
VDYLISIDNDSDMFERFQKSMMMEFEITWLESDIS